MSLETALAAMQKKLDIVVNTNQGEETDMSTCPKCGWYKYWPTLDGKKKCAMCGHVYTSNKKKTGK